MYFSPSITFCVSGKKLHMDTKLVSGKKLHMDTEMCNWEKYPTGTKVEKKYLSYNIAGR